jgi:hypothetical protein
MHIVKKLDRLQKSIDDIELLLNTISIESILNSNGICIELNMKVYVLPFLPTRPVNVFEDSLHLQSTSASLAPNKPMTAPLLILRILPSFVERFEEENHTHKQ